MPSTLDELPASDQGGIFDDLLWRSSLDSPPNRGVIETATSSLARGTHQLAATGLGLGGVIAETFGADQFAKSFMRGYTRQMAQAAGIPAEIGSYTNIRSLSEDPSRFIKDVGTYINEGVFENLPNMAASMVGGEAGAVVGGALVKRAVAKRVAERSLGEKFGAAAAERIIGRGRLLGAETGAFAANTGQEIGSIGGDIYDKTGEISVPESIAGGVAAGAVETLGELGVLKKVFGEAVAGKLNERLRWKLARIGETAGKQFSKEALTEAIQTGIEEASTYHALNEPEKPFWTPELVDSIIDSALKGGASGAVMGMGAQIVQEARRKEKVNGLRAAADANRAAGNPETADALQAKAADVEFQPATLEQLKPRTTTTAPAGKTVLVNPETGTTDFPAVTQPEADKASEPTPEQTASAPDSPQAKPVADQSSTPLATVNPAPQEASPAETVDNSAKPQSNAQSVVSPPSDFANLLTELDMTPEEHTRASSVSADLVPMPEAFKDAVEVRPSGIHGQGVFTTEDIKPGQEIAPALVAQPDGIKRTPAGRYVNHAGPDDANTRLVVRDGAAMLVATRPIDNGEELSVDYREQQAVADALRTGQSSPAASAPDPAVASAPEAGAPATPADVPGKGESLSPAKTGTGIDPAKLADIKARRAEIQRKLREKLKQIGSAPDPEILTLAAQMAANYAEEGAVKFKDFAARTKSEMGDVWEQLKRYLHAAWQAAGADNPALDDVSRAEAADHIQAVDSVEPSAEPPADPIRAILISNDSPQKKAAQIRKLADERGLTVKQMQETAEAEIVKASNAIASDTSMDAGERFAALVNLYKKQPTLSARTSTSVANQAYSTPAPLAFALSHATLTNPKTSVYDPTGGTGMLFIGANLKQSIANELNPERATFLRGLGIGTVTEHDATKFVPAEKVQSVHTNPPFRTIPVVNYDGYGIKKLEHLIALKALEAMQDNGTAMIVLGANMNEGDTKRGAQWVFENYLYGHYNVADNFEVDGDLYGKQGAKWPVRVLVVAGRRQFPIAGELAPQRVDRIQTWDDVWARAQKARDEVTSIRSGLGTAEPAGLPAGVPEGGSTGEATGNVTAGSGSVAAPADSGGKRGGTSRGGTEAGTFAGGSPGVAAGPESAGVRGPSVAQPGPAGITTSGVEGGGGTGIATAPDAASGSLGTGAATQSGIVSQPAAVSGQIAYQPRSGATTLETLTPANIGPGTHAALDELVERVGPVDEFVSDRLQMPVRELRQVLAAEQVDTVALAIDQMENGGAVIVGSETGIGKGRMGAATIRYAVLNDKIPVFFTKDPKLFSDMAGDLRDIHTEVKPLIFGDPDKARIVDTEGNVLATAPTKAKQNRIMREIQADGMEKAGYNAIFSTYSQVNQENERQRFLEWLAGNHDVVLVLDEAHEAAGDAESSMQAAFFSGGDVERGKGKDKVKITKSGLLNAEGTKRGRGGVLYLSATFAKRPENMPLYFRTALSMATKKFEDLVNAMKSGGVAMQQAISEALAGVGQYVRHERDFSGVKYQTKLVEDVDKDKLIEQVDDTTNVLRSIVDFSKRVIAAVQEGQDGKGTAMSEDAMSMTDFASIAHNQVGQLLLAAKADTVVREAIAAKARGEKPIIALMNTMESFLSQFVESQGIKPGEDITLRWNELLKFALDRTLRMQIKHPNGDTEVVQLTPDQLGLQAQYDRVLAMANKLDIALPVSPIDYIIQKLEAAGIKMGEMTGRESGILYDNPEKGSGTYRHFNKANKNTLVNAFNSGQLDGLLLNASGSTGLSLHAASKFKDQSKRHMFIAQPALDINVFVQTLGRIKRTGMLPGSAEYSHLVLPLQAELRPAAVTSKKMKSLNANTTAEAQGAVKIQTDDFLNKYGDGVVAEYLENNPDLQDITGLFVSRNVGGELEYPKDLARKFTGRMALMPDAAQEEAYKEIIPAYRQLVDRLKATGEYDLDIVVHDDWDAVRESDTELSPGTDESNLFTASTRAQEWEISDERHVPTGEEMKREFQENTGGWEAIKAKWDRFNAEANQRLTNLNGSAQAEVNEAMAMPEGDAKNSKVAAAAKKVQTAKQMEQRWQNTRGFLIQVLNLSRRGAVNIEETGMNTSYDGALVNFKFPDLGKGLRVSPSAFHFTFLTNNPGGRLYLNGAELNGKFTVAESTKDYSDFTGKQSGQRYTRWVVTGNPIAAYQNTGGKGKLVRFKSREGNVVTGLLMPNAWDISKLTSDPRVELINGKAVESLLRNAPYYSSISAQLGDGAAARIQPNRGRYMVSVPSSRKGGNALYLNDRVLKLTGDFWKSGSRMIAEISGERIAAVADAISDVAGQRWRASGANDKTIEQVRAANDSARPSKLDSAIAALDNLDRKLSSNQYSDPFLLTPIAKLAIKIAKGLLRAGRSVEVAIREAIAQAKEQMPDDTTDPSKIEQALTAGMDSITGEDAKPAFASGESKVSRSMEEFTPETLYRTETEAGRTEAADRFINETHGGDLEKAFADIALSSPRGMPDSVRIIAAARIAQRAAQNFRESGDANDERLARKALVIAKQDGSETGQALQAVHQANKQLAADDAFLTYYSANNEAIDRLLSARFPDVTSHNIKAWLVASGREAVKAVADLMSRTNNVTARVLRIVGREAGIDWANLFTSSAVDQKRWQQDLFAKINEHLLLQKLQDKEKLELVNLLSEAWQRERMKVFRREFNKNVALPGVKETDKAKLESALPELVKQLNLGLLENEAFRNAVAPRYGEKPVSLADAKALYEQSQAAQAKPEGFQRDRAFRAIYDEMQRRSGTAAREIIKGWWYASVLSGMGTQGRNIIGNASILVENMMASALRNPRAVPQLVAGMWRGMRENATQGEFKAIMSGDVTARPGMDIKAGSNALELAKDAPERWKRLLSNGRYVTRFMLAADSFFYDAAAEVAAINTVIAQNRNADWKTVEAKIFDTLNLSPEKRAAAEARAKSEGLTGTDLKRRVVEILEQERPSEILDSQHRFALEATLNNEPQGLLGATARALVAQRSKFPPLTAVAPFIRISANVGNMLLQHSPLGLYWVLRNWRSEGQNWEGSKSGAWTGHLVGIRPDLTPEEYQQLRAKVLLSHAALASAFTLAASGADDKDPWFQVTGSMEGLDPQKRRQLEQQGLRPYSVKVGDRSFDYRQTPWATGFASVGSWMDGYRYDPKFNDKEFSVRLATSLASGKMVILDQNFLSNLMVLLDRGSQTAKDASAGGALTFLGRTVGGVVPSVVKEADSMLYPDVQKAQTAWDHFVREFPFIRRDVGTPVFNVLGDPIQRPRYPWSWLTSGASDDPVWQALGEKAQRGVFLPAPSAAATVLADGKRQKMTPDQLAKYQQEVGRLYREKLTRDLGRFRAMSPEQATEYFKREFEPLREQARMQQSR